MSARSRVRVTRPLFYVAALIFQVAVASQLQAAAGDLDCSFAIGGIATSDLGSIEAAFDAQLQSDGGIVTLGSGSDEIRLSRFLANGDLDPTFGTGGTIVHSFAGLAFAGGLAIDGLDRLVVSGSITVSGDSEAFVARFTSEGAVDSSFGGGDGWTSFDWTAATASAGTDQGGLVAVDTTKRPVVGGWTDANGFVFNPSDRNMAIARLTVAGALDATFGTGGISIASSPGTANDDDLRAMKIDSAGRIVGIGSTYYPNATNFGPRNTILARWTDTGALDTTFDSDGVLLLDLTLSDADDFGIDLDFDSLGRILALGQGNGDPILARLDTSGGLDPAFSGDGLVQQSFLGSQDVVERVLVQADDKPLVTGWPVNGFSFHIAIMRFSTGGALDNSWGNQGVATTQVGFNERIYAAILQPDQRLVVAGGLDNDRDLVMARYLNDGQANTALTTTQILSHQPNPSLVGETVTVTYSVTSNAGTPSGSVTISDGTAASCTGTVADGSCDLAWGIAPGERTMTATYPGGGGFCASFDTATHTVQVPTQTSFTSFTPSSSVVGEPVFVGVDVAPLNAGGVGPVTGSVTIDDGAGASCVGALSAGTASCELIPSVAGTHTWTATYSVDGHFAASSRTTTRSIAPASTTTAITADTPDPSIIHQSFQVDVAVSVVAPGSGAPGGDVHVTDGAGASCTATLAAGVGSCMLTPTDLGTRDLEAAYLGDGNYLTSTATEPHAVTDGIAPQVSSVTSVEGPAVDECVTVRAEITALDVVFDEPVEGADQIDGYLVLGTGPDADFSTMSCGAIVGDDVAHAISSVTSDLDPSTPTLTLRFQDRLSTGLTRLIVCESIEDLGSLPLDGDGDGTGGDPFVRTFRVDPRNLFANGHFDRCPVTLAPWIEVATPPDAILPSTSEDADGSVLSGSVQILSASAASAALAQCVELDAPAPRLDLALEARLDTLGTTAATLGAQCEFYGLASCVGPVYGSDSESATLQDLSGAWSGFHFQLQPPPTTLSALCSVVVTPDQPADPMFDAYLDRLSLDQSLLFADGFETGNTTAWSTTVQD